MDGVETYQLLDLIEADLTQLERSELVAWHVFSKPEATPLQNTSTSMLYLKQWINSAPTGSANTLPSASAHHPSSIFVREGDNTLVGLKSHGMI